MRRKKVQLQVRITEEMLSVMDKHIAANPLYNTRAKWFAAAAEDWFTWLENEADENWVPYRAHSHGEKISVSVMPDLKQRLEDAAKGHQLVDIYWTVIIHFARRYKLDEFIHDPTPGVLNLSVPNETADVIDAYIDGAALKTLSIFGARRSNTGSQCVKARTTHMSSTSRLLSQTHAIKSSRSHASSTIRSNTGLKTMGSSPAWRSTTLEQRTSIPSQTETCKRSHRRHFNGQTLKEKSMSKIEKRQWLGNVPAPTKTWNRTIPEGDARLLTEYLRFVQQHGEPNASMDHLMEKVFEAFFRRQSQDFDVPEETTQISFTITLEIERKIEEAVEAQKETHPRATDRHLVAHAVDYFLNKRGALQDAFRAWQTQQEAREQENMPQDTTPRKEAPVRTSQDTPFSSETERVEP